MFWEYKTDENVNVVDYVCFADKNKKRILDKGQYRKENDLLPVFRKMFGNDIQNVYLQYSLDINDKFHRNPQKIRVLDGLVCHIAWDANSSVLLQLVDGTYTVLAASAFISFKHNGFIDGGEASYDEPSKELLEEFVS